jgi:hypothetical protein
MGNSASFQRVVRDPAQDAAAANAVLPDKTCGHGRYAYVAGCASCQTYQRARVARNRAAARVRAFAGLTHGRRSTYDAGCHCDACTAAKYPWRRP